MKKFGLGRLLYRFIHAPLAARRQPDWPMRQTARSLGATRLPPAPRHWPPVLFLTGRDFWHQTVFCAHSFERMAGVTVPWEFHDDGSLDTAGRQALRRAFPSARIVGPAEIQARLDSHLPISRYPALRAARERMPLMRKLTDLRAGRQGPSLFLDSDMLFFAPPRELLAWLEKPAGHWFMHDELENYVAPRAEIVNQVAQALLPQVNSGVLAMNDADTPFDWDACEQLSAANPAYAQHRLWEQTLTALHLSRVGGRRLPRENYRLVFENFITPPSADLIHYCWHAKLPYLATEWRRALECPLPPALPPAVPTQA